MVLTHIGTQTIETERLVLRRYAPDDAESMFRNYARDAEVCRFLSWEPYQNVDGVRETLARWQEDYQRPDFYLWAIVLNDEVIGGIDAREFDERNCAYELGYSLSRAYWGHGITTEAANAVVNYLFSKVSMHRITAKHDVKNPASGAVMRHLGMRYEGTYKGHYVRNNGDIADALVYAILRDEWEAQKHNPV